MDLEHDVEVEIDPRPPVDVAPQPPETPPSADATPPPAAPPPAEPLPKGVQKRIDRAVRDKYEAQARAKMLEERLSALESRAAPPPPAAPAAPDAAEPTIDKFQNFDDYVRAKAEFIAKRQIEQTLQEREQRSAAASAAAAHHKTVEQWQDRVAKATAEMPDFEDVVSSSTVPMTEPMSRAIMESDIGPKLAYYLASHPDEAFTISAMSPVSTIRALGRIEERLTTQPTEVRTTNAPPPVTPVGSRTTVKKGPGQMSDAEYAKWRKTASL